MPDLSLFKPLCDELNISINELLSGEKLNKKEYQEKLEENIINTINYGNKKVKEKNDLIGIILIIFGVLISFTAMTIFSSDSSWGSVYSVFGGIISLIGVSKFTKKLIYWKRLLCNFGYFTIFICLLFLIDYIGVVTIHQAPRFSYIKKTIYNMIVYNTPFYNVYRINFDTDNEYYIVDTKKIYTTETVPNVLFDRDKTGIDNIIKYKNKYIGDNSNTGNLINDLPLSEYGYVFEIDSNKLGLTINYHITDWYINENLYLERSLIYNSIAIFSLIDNVDYIYFNFSGMSYHVTRKQIEDLYPNYEYIVKSGINKNNFNQYLESQINNDEFVNYFFKTIFIDENIRQVNKIVVKNSSDEKIIKTITNENEIEEVIELMLRASKINGNITLDGNWWNIYMYNEDQLIYKFLSWGFNSYGSCFGIDGKEYLLVGLDGERFSELIQS